MAKRMRLSPPDRDAVTQLSTALGAVGRLSERALDSFVIDLRDVLAAERVLAYGVSVHPDGFQLEFARASGFRSTRAVLSTLLQDGMRAAHGRPWALYDPRRPSLRQRNVVIELPPATHLSSPAGAALFDRLRVARPDRPRLVDRMRRLNDGMLRRLGMNDMHVCRAILCDGPNLLAWIGAVQSDSFSDRQRTILSELLLPLERRLRFERQWESARLHDAAVPALLEALAKDAFVVSAGGDVCYANSEGRALAGQGYASLRRVILDAIADPERGDFTVTPLAAAGLPLHYLLVRRYLRDDKAARMRTAVKRWGLTARERDVLEWIVRGESTKTIAATMGRVERTVEVHITHLLAKAGVASRSALIALFWSM